MSKVSAWDSQPHGPKAKKPSSCGSAFIPPGVVRATHPHLMGYGSKSNVRALSGSLYAELLGPVLVQQPSVEGSMLHGDRHCMQGCWALWRRCARRCARAAATCCCA